MPNPPKAPKLPKPVVKDKFDLSKEIRQVGNIKLRFEGIPDAEMNFLGKAVDEMVSALTGDMSDDEDLMPRWFGLSAVDAKSRLGVMRDYMTRRCEVITFVRKLTGGLCNNLLVESGDYGQMIWTVLTAGLTKHDLRVPGGEVNVPRGLRIFLSPAFFDETPADGEINEKLNCVFHEISHKVLVTLDYKYGEEDCLKLAKTQPAKAAENADNYGYLFAEYVLKWS